MARCSFNATGISHFNISRRSGPAGGDRLAFEWIKVSLYQASITVAEYLYSGFAAERDSSMGTPAWDANRVSDLEF